MGAIAIAATEVQRTPVRRDKPSIYVPRRTRVGALEGIPHGAAIVGTPQDDETVAIDVECTRYIDPNVGVWAVWIAEAARRHRCGDEEHPPGERTETMIVAEHELVEIGHFEDGCILVSETGRNRLSSWIDAGRTAHLADGRPAASA